MGCLLLGALAGAAGMFFWIGPPLADASQVAMERYMAAEAYPRYRYGSYPVAKKALLLHAELASALSRDAAGPRARILASEAGISYGRLALAAERANAPADRDLYCRLAREEYQRQGQRPSDDEIRELVLTLDRNWDQELRGPVN